MGKVFGGGSAPKTAPVMQSAPSSVAAAAVDNASENARNNMRDKLRYSRGRDYTNRTAGEAVDQLKKALLGE